MRSAIGFAFGAVVVACSPENPGPALTINPSGSVAISGPTELTATLVNSSEVVTWSVDGAGTLSNETGFHVTYVPPPGTTMATVTAATSGLSASVQIISAPATITAETVPGLTAPVTVQYDAEQIPHIRCATAVDCFAVQGYLQARDRLFPMDFLRHTARSNLAEMIGVAGLSQDVQLRTLFMTRAGHRVEEDLTRVLDPASRRVLDAFVTGVNAYLHELRATPGARLPGEYDQLPYALTPAEIPDWTIQDSMALSRLFEFQLSESLSQELEWGKFAAVYAQGPLADPGKLNAWIRAAAPPSERAHTLAPLPFMGAAGSAPTRPPTIDLSPWQAQLDRAATTAAATRAFLRRAGADAGSNNWVVSAAKSSTHVAMVANDPHLSLQYPPQFYLSVMTSSDPSDHLDLAGGAFPGLPAVLVGRGAHVGWGVTVVGYDVTDVYLEQVVPCASPSPAPCVLFQGAPVPTLPVPETFGVRVGPGAAIVDAKTLSLASPPPPYLLVVPHHGPIVQAPDATGKAVSVRWTGQEGNTQDIAAFLGLDTAIDVDSAMAALAHFAVGAQNFVLADDQGHIAYDPHAFVPVRRFADVRLRGANVIPPWFPLPGDGSAEWGDGVSNCAAATLDPVPASCWIADDLLPHGKDPAKGYYFTANADPTYPSVSDDNNPLAHPPYLSFAWADSTGFRATRIDQMLASTIATNGSISLADMEAIQTDHVSRPGALFTDIIRQIPTSASTPSELAVAQMVLETWASAGFSCPSGLLGVDPVTSAVDTTPAVVESSAGCMLFHVFLRRLLTTVFADDLAVVHQSVSGDEAIKAMLYMLSLDPSTPQGAAGSKFCNDVDTSGQLVAAHTCTEQVVAALAFSVDFLSAHVGPPSEWVWGRVHTMTPVSQFPLVTIGYAPGPYARPGGAFTVDVGTPSLADSDLDYSYTSSGQVRHISVMDPATPIVKMQLPGPEVDNPAVFVGPDLLGQWLTNTYFDFAYGDQIDRAVVSTQTFSAK